MRANTRAGRIRAGTALTYLNDKAEPYVDPVKAALEASVRYLAADLGGQDIRVNALSPGPVATQAASGIAHFDTLIDEARDRAPEHRLVTIEEVGAFAAFLASDQAASITGNTSFVDAGYHVMS